MAQKTRARGRLSEKKGLMAGTLSTLEGAGSVVALPLIYAPSNLAANNDKHYY